MSTVPHGALDYAELETLGLSPDDLIDFSSNINPFGPPPGLVDALRHRLDASLLARYPDRECLAVRRRLAQHHGCTPAEVLVGNGSAALIALLMQRLARGKRVVVLAPTFGEYAHAATLAGAKVTLVARPGWQALEEGRFEPDERRGLDEVATTLQYLRPDMVVLCHPNNPTGDYLPPEAVAFLRRATPGALWLFDAAYDSFCDRPVSTIPPTRETILLHSLTKDFALAGLRLGYLLAHSDMINDLYRAQPPWNVNALAQQAAILALDEIEWRRESIAMLLAERQRVVEALKHDGWHPLPTTTNFFLLPVGDASRLRHALLPHGVLVRDATSFGLPRYIRIAVRRPEENVRLRTALRAVKQEMSNHLP